MEQFFDKNPIDGNFPICNGCKNYISGEKCKAFNFIPDLILLWENNHSKPLDGQENDIIFEEIKEK